MSKQALTQVVQRSISDAAFRHQLATDAPGALRGFDLTADEISAMRTRDLAKLTAFGVDVRMSKVFVLDQGTTGSATLSSASEPRDIAPVWIGEGATGTEPRDIAPVWIGDGSQALSTHTYSGDDNAGPEAAVATGSEPRDIAPVWIGEMNVASDGIATDEGQLTNDVPAGTEAHLTGGGDLNQ